MPEPTPEAWAQIRHDYENTDRPLAHICADNDITIPMMRYRMKRWEWTRRKPLIPRQGPPPVPEPGISADTSFHPPLEGEGKEDAVPYHYAPPLLGEGAENAPASIVPRLQSAVARVLSAIEATIARLASGAHHPRDMEQAGRTLSSLTRTLRELNALLAQHKAESGDDEPLPRQDIDEFRQELSRRLKGIIEARRAAKAQET